MWLYLLLAVGVSDRPAAIIGQETRRTEMEDLSCKAVNDAFVATFHVPALTVKTYGLKPDGSTKLHDEARYNAGRVYEKLAVSDRWMKNYRGGVETTDEHGPIFTACRELKAEAGDEPALRHYAATWHGFPFKAAYEVWVSRESGRATKATLDYSHTTWQFPFPKAVELFSYDPADAMPPTGN